MKRKAFTLIELIAVLVILAILALIVTPLVMNIIKKARISADKRSIDAYGRSIELSIATFLLDNGRFPTSINDLTIEYTGDQVICSTTQLNSDSSVYLTGCTVAGRSIDYTYGIDKSPTYTAYSVGDEVTYNGVDYYVIKDSSIKDATVTLLKKVPLSCEEVQTYSVGTDAIVDTSMCYYRDFASMQYHSSSSNYETSYIKQTVDAWKNDKAQGASEARLITYDELIENLGYNSTISSAGNPIVNENVPSWVYNSNYSYWTMTPYDENKVRIVSNHGTLDAINGGQVYGRDNVVRPVIVLSKSVLD